MMEKLQGWYATLNAREQRIVLIGAMAAALLLLLAIFLPLHRNAVQLQDSIERKRDDLAWLRSMAAPLAAAASMEPQRGGGPQQSLVAMVDRQAREMGLSDALRGSQPSGNGGLSVRFEDAGFDALVTLLGRLAERGGVRVENASIEATKTAGHVNASLVLRNG